jgi:hypothetical protein
MRYQAVYGTPPAEAERVGAGRAAAAAVAPVAARGTGEGSALAKSAKPSADHVRSRTERDGGELTAVLGDRSLGWFGVGAHQAFEEGCHFEASVMAGSNGISRTGRMVCRRDEWLDGWFVEKVEKKSQRFHAKIRAADCDPCLHPHP